MNNEIDNDNDNKQIICTEGNLLSASTKEDKFQIFLNQGKRKSFKSKINHLSVTLSSRDLSNLLPNRQTKPKERKRNLVTVSSFSSLSKSFMNRSYNEQLSFPIHTIEEMETIKYSRIKLPEIVNINEQIGKQAEEIDKSMTEVIVSYDNLNKAKNSLLESKRKLTTFQKELIEAKESRNQVLKDVYQMRNEIEMTKIQGTESNLDNSNYISQRVMTGTGTGMSRLKYVNNVTYTSNNESEYNDLDEQIEQYEDKICKLKSENTLLFENYDLLKGDYMQNEALNIKLKNAISSLEYNIQNSLKEKANLKSIISKLPTYSNGKI